MLGLRLAARTARIQQRSFSSITANAGEVDLSNTSAVFRVFSRTTALGKQVFPHLEVEVEKSDIDRLAARDALYSDASRDYEARSLVHNTADLFPSAKRFGINSDANIKQILKSKEHREDKEFKNQLIAMMRLRELRGKRSVLSNLSKSGQQEVTILLKKYIETTERPKKEEYFERIQSAISKQNDETELKQRFGLVNEVDYEAVTSKFVQKELPNGQ